MKWKTGMAVAGAAALALAPGGLRLAKRRLRSLRNDHRRRPQLWESFYARDWGETDTNNYGFAPAEGERPQRFQEQMYRELIRRLRSRVAASDPVRLLEVSCGRGGGLSRVVREDATLDATGLDVAPSATEYATQAHGRERLNFVTGNALALPFGDAGFDAVLNVEASNDYGDRPGFFAEVARVLKPGGWFLYTDSFRTGDVEAVKRQLTEAGFTYDVDDITPNVAESCRLDSQRRADVIRRQVPWLLRKAFGKQLANYGALEGSSKYDAFRDGRRTYLMFTARAAS